MAIFEIHMDVVCQYHGVELDYEIISIDNFNRIKVTPCEKCLEQAVEDAKGEKND